MAWPKGKPRKQKIVTQWPDESNGNGDTLLLDQPAPPSKKRGPRTKFVIPTQEQLQAQALAGFDLNVLAQALAKGIVEGMKASKREETRVQDERTENHRLRMRKQLSDDREGNMRKWENCSHMRSHPYSGTSRIAWATQSDGITRGTCMHCGCPFSPVASELPDPKMLDWYKRMIGVPMTAAQNDFITGMVAAGNPA